MTRQTSLRFSVKHQALLNKRSVLGSTEKFGVQDLLKLQKDADYEPDKRNFTFFFLPGLSLTKAKSYQACRYARPKCHSGTSESKAQHASFVVLRFPQRYSIVACFSQRPFDDDAKPASVSKLFAYIPAKFAEVCYSLSCDPRDGNGSRNDRPS